MLDLLTLKDFSKELGKPESTVRTWIRRGELPENMIVKIGGTIFIHIEKFKNWIDKQT